jgi:signal transduction histidine kinase
LKTALGRLNIRTRLMIIGLGGLAVGFLVGGIVLVAALGYALQRTVDSEALGTATDVAALVNAGALPEPIPVTRGQLVQVVDAQHSVRSTSLTADRLVPLLRPDELAAARSGRRLFIDGERVGVEGPLRVVAVPAGPRRDPQTVIVAQPVRDLRESVGALRAALLVAYPLLLLALGIVGWRFVGAALRPVEELRAGAETITGRHAEDRLPVPDTRDEINRLARTLNDMLDRLAAGRARQRAFVADAAHELRSPLTNMRTELEVARRMPDDTDWSGLTDDLLADIERLTRLVNDLLLLARVDAAAPVDRAEPVELGALLGDVAERHRSARVPVELDVDGPQWTTADPDAVRRAVDNLVDNAVRHARNRVCLGLSGGVVTVVDDGPGIPEADRERVFDRFTRLDDARARDGGGAGLGLAIVRELVRRQGGTVVLADAGPGVRAEVRLPVDTPGRRA